MTALDTSCLDPLIADLCEQVGLGQPTGRHPIRVWELSGVERLTFADTASVVVKYAGPPFTREADVLRAARKQHVPVPAVIASTTTNDLLVMLLEDLGGSSHAPTDIDGARAAARLHTAYIRPDRLSVWDAPRLAALPTSAITMLTALRERGRLTAADDLLPPLEQLARDATALVDGAETAPFGLVHGELHPTSLHIGAGGWRLVDFAKAFVGPGLLDLATWQGTRRPADIPRLEAQLRAYIAAGGSARVVQARGGHPAAVWALGWHRLWSAGWFLRQAVTRPDDDHQDQEMEAILRRQITAAAALLRRR